jgi:hypothetical protein
LFSVNSFIAKDLPQRDVLAVEHLIQSKFTVSAP